MLALLLALWAQLHGDGLCFVDQIDNGHALLMRADESTVTVPAQPEWREGQTVTCPAN